MAHALGQILLFPFKLAVAVIELLGRTLAVATGTGAFGAGALLCACGPLLTVIGAPMMLLGAIVVIKAL